MKTTSDFLFYFQNIKNKKTMIKKQPDMDSEEMLCPTGPHHSQDPGAVESSGTVRFFWSVLPWSARRRSRKAIQDLSTVQRKTRSSGRSRLSRILLRRNFKMMTTCSMIIPSSTRMKANSQRFKVSYTNKLRWKSSSSSSRNNSLQGKRLWVRANQLIKKWSLLRRGARISEHGMINLNRAWRNLNSEWGMKIS